MSLDAGSLDVIGSLKILQEQIDNVENESLHTGVRRGLTLVLNTTTTFDVAEGDAIIVNNDPNPLETTITKISKAEETGILDTNLSEAISHIYMDAAGTITVETQPPMTISDVFDRIYLGTILHFSGIIVAVIPDSIVAHGSSNTGIMDLVFAGGTKATGSLITANGANLQLDITDGILRQVGRGFGVNANAPNDVETPASSPVLQADFFLIYLDAAGDVVTDNSSNVLDPAQINLNGAGTLTSVGMNNYSVIRVFQAGITNDLLFYYGTIAFATIADAQSLAEPTWVEHEDTRTLSPVAKIYIRGNVTDLATAITAGDAIIESITSRTQL